jgi:purine-binding chemotaxis protein CheW
MHVVVFFIENQRFGCDLATVLRVIPAMEVTPIPNAPKAVMGAINLHGEVISVFHMRTLLGIAQGEVSSSNHILVCHCPRATVALWVDYVIGIENIPEENITSTESPFPHPDIAYIAKSGEELLFIYNIATLLSQS